MPDDIEFVFPKFHRDKNEPIPACAPSDSEAWEALRCLDKNALIELGLRPWDESDHAGYTLMLFPGEWYKYIPNGYRIVDINDVEEEFQTGITDNDIRLGMLAFGIKVKI